MGSSKHLGERIKQHYTLLKRGKHHSIKLQNFVQKYGIQELTLYVEITELSRKDLFKEETNLISSFDSYKNGFNMSMEAHMAPVTEEQRAIIGERMRKANTGKICSEEHKRKVGIAKSIQNSGENNPSAKLTEDDIREIRLMRDNGSSYKEIMKQFNLKSRSYLWSILSKKLWKHVI